ncbi:hypothetical protein ACTXT7_014706 [Hymenolepis weldensis]
MRIKAASSERRGLSTSWLLVCEFEGTNGLYLTPGASQSHTDCRVSKEFVVWPDTEDLDNAISVDSDMESNEHLHTAKSNPSSRILIQFKADTNLTINELKEYIEQAIRIPAQSQTLTYNGVLLDGSNPLKSFRLPQTIGICLDVPLAYPSKYNIYVKTPLHNRPVKVRVGIEGTIGDLKKAIFHHENVLMDHAILVHNSCVLSEENENQTLTSLGIGEDSEVEIIVRRTKFESVRDFKEKKAKKEKTSSLPPSGFSTMDGDSEVEVGNYRMK